MKINRSSVTGLIFAAFAALFLLGVPTYIHVISAYENEASPRNFPTLVAGVLLILSLLLACKNLFGSGDPDKAQNISRTEVYAVCICFLIVGTGIFAMPYVGFIVATTFILLALSVFLGVRSVKALAAFGIGWPLFVYGVFVKGFMITFPQWSLF